MYSLKKVVSYIWILNNTCSQLLIHYDCIYKNVYYDTKIIYVH